MNNEVQPQGPLQVYHNPDFHDAYHSGGQMPTVEGSVLVATVQTDDLDVAFEKTNNINYAWTENDGLTVHGGPRHRSTSMGDLIVDSNGNVFICASAGWHTPQQYRAYMVIHEQRMAEWRVQHAKEEAEKAAKRQEAAAAMASVATHHSQWPAELLVGTPYERTA